MEYGNSSTKTKHDNISLNNNDRNSTSMPLEIPIENHCEDGKRFSSSQRSSSKMDFDSLLCFPQKCPKGTMNIEYHYHLNYLVAK